MLSFHLLNSAFAQEEIATILQEEMASELKDAEFAVRYLIFTGVDINAPDENGETLLMKVVRGETRLVNPIQGAAALPLVALFIPAGIVAVMHLFTIKFVHRIDTMLSLSQEDLSQALNIVALCTEGGNPDVVNSEGQTALEIAIANEESSDAMISALQYCESLDQ